MVHPHTVAQFESLLNPYTTPNVELPFYWLTVDSAVSGTPGLYLVEFRLQGETAIAFHFDLTRSTFRVVTVGPAQVEDFDALVAVFDQAKAFVAAARALGYD